MKKKTNSISNSFKNAESFKKDNNNSNNILSENSKNSTKSVMNNPTPNLSQKENKTKDTAVKRAKAVVKDNPDKKLAQEEVWIRQGIKARRTRNEGRVRSLEKMREERSSRRNLQGNARFQVSGAERSGKIVDEISEVSHQLD